MGSMKGVLHAADTNFAEFDDKTKLFTSSVYSPVHYPDDLTIDQFMFGWSPEQASKSGKYGEGHVRPDPTKLEWLIEPHTSRSYTFATARERSAQLAGLFQSHYGLGNDDVVAIYSPNDLDYGPVCWGAFRLGGIVSGANPSYTEGELAYQLEVLAKSHRLKAFITHPASLEVALKAAGKAKFPLDKVLLVGPNKMKPKDAPKEVLTLDEAIEKHAKDNVKLPPEPKLGPGGGRKKVAFLSFSSGTTGLPKAVRISHSAVISNVVMITRVRDGAVKPGQRALAALPFYHIYGLVVVLHASIYLGAACVIVPKFDFVHVLDLIVSQKISILYFVPPMVVLMSKHPAVSDREKKLGETIKDIMVGAAPLTDEIVSAFRKRFPQVSLGQGYGMTETSTVITHPPRLDSTIPGSSAGVLAPNVEIRILSTDNKPLGVGELGEVVSKSPSNAIDYLDNAKATEETFDKEGFVHTGDEGYIDDKGWLYVVDRRKELIKVKGNQVAPAELEGHLLGHPQVSDVCVIGVPDEYAGEAPRAYVVLAGDAVEKVKKDPKAEEELAESIKKWVADKKIKYKHLAGGVEFIDAIPKNPSGKLLRRELRDQFKAKQKKAKL